VKFDVFWKEVRNYTGQKFELKPSFKTQKLLNSIRADDSDVVYRDICIKAAEWASCGFMSEANHLLDVLWQYDSKNFDKDRRINEGFQVMWKASGLAPKTKIPFELSDIKKIEKKNLDYFLKPYGMPAIDDLGKPLAETPVDHLFVKSIFLYSIKKAAPEEVLDSLKKFLKESRHATHYTHFQAATSGCLIAAHCKNEILLKEFLTIWTEGFRKYTSKYFVTYLMSDRLIARFLLTGIFADKLSVTRSDCRFESKLLEDALKERSEKGRTLIYGHLNWQELLKRISELSIHYEEMEFTSDQIEKKWLGFEPASINEIRLKEAELGIQFPQDYIDFLLTSNGFIACQSTFPTLCPISEVGFLRDIEPDIIDLFDPESDGKLIFNSIRNSVFIGGLHDEQQMFLGPVENGEWVCWFFASWLPGEWRFQSLRYYMEYILRELEETEFDESSQQDS
jgi:hypothetical protein